MLQRRKRYKNRTILGYKTLAVGCISMAEVSCSSQGLLTHLDIFPSLQTHCCHLPHWEGPDRISSSFLNSCNQYSQGNILTRFYYLAVILSVFCLHMLIAEAFTRIASDLLRVLLLFCGFIRVRGSRSKVQNGTESLGQAFQPWEVLKLKQDLLCFSVPQYESSELSNFSHLLEKPLVIVISWLLVI